MKEDNDFLHTEAFSWCKGIEEKESNESEDKHTLIFSLSLMIILFIAMFLANKYLGIIFE